MIQGPDFQAFGDLKIFYPWLGDEHLTLLQTVYRTWKQLAKANPQALVRMLSGIPHPPEPPDINQVVIIIAYAGEKVRLQEEETT